MSIAVDRVLEEMVATHFPHLGDAPIDLHVESGELFGAVICSPIRKPRMLIIHPDDTDTDVLKGLLAHELGHYQQNVPPWKWHYRLLYAMIERSPALNRWYAARVPVPPREWKSITEYLNHDDPDKLRRKRAIIARERWYEWQADRIAIQHGCGEYLDRMISYFAARRQRRSI